MTIKSKWYGIIFVLVASIVLLTGCGGLTEGEAGLSDDGGYIEEETEFNEETGSNVTDNEAGLSDDGGYIEEFELNEEPGSSVTESPNTEVTVTGTVKEADVTTGKVIIVSEDDSEIALDVPSEELFAELVGFAEEGTQITVEYNDATKTVTNVISQADTQVTD